MSRRAARVDANQSEIVTALRAMGAEVTDLSGVGSGVCDLLVSYRGNWYAIEIKDGRKPPSERRLTSDQVTWHGKQRAPVHVVTSRAEALDAIGATSGTPWRIALGDELPKGSM